MIKCPKCNKQCILHDHNRSETEVRYHCLKCKHEWPKYLLTPAEFDMVREMYKEIDRPISRNSSNLQRRTDLLKKVADSGETMKKLIEEIKLENK